MKQKDLNTILDDHKLWLDSNGEKGTCADLSGADLEGADLSDAVLRGADLTNANLINADLSYATLEDANLKGANLSNAYLEYADLKGVNLAYANLEGANLKGANLRDAVLIDADLKNITLPSSLDNLPEGELIGYKKVQGYIVKLQILADSKRSRATSDKCRCDKALVLAIENIDGTDSCLKQIFNHRFTPTTYEVGKIVYADLWDEDRWKECSHGIHFFLDRQMAVEW